MYFAPNYQKHVESLITLFQPRSQVATILIVICITTGSPSSSSLRELNWEFSWEPEKKIEVKSLFQEVAFRILVSQHQGFFMKGAAYVSSDLCLLCSFVLDHEVRTHNSKVLDRFMTKTDYNKNNLFPRFQFAYSLWRPENEKFYNLHFSVCLKWENDDSPLSMNFEARNARWNRRIRSIEGHN